MTDDTLKPLYWIRSSKKDLLQFPKSVIQAIGYSLDRAQCGKKPVSAKPLKNVGSNVFEIVEDYDTDTYRAVYTVYFEKAVYVLHCFQKKSTKGISTPKREIELIHQRLKDAAADYKERFQ